MTKRHCLALASSSICSVKILGFLQQGHQITHRVNLAPERTFPYLFPLTICVRWHKKCWLDALSQWRSFHVFLVTLVLLLLSQVSSSKVKKMGVTCEEVLTRGEIVYYTIYTLVYCLINAQVAVWQERLCSIEALVLV